MEAFNRPHLLLYRLDRPLDPLAAFGVRAVAECSSAGLRIVDSRWLSIRRGEVRVRARGASPPWPGVALAVALYLGLGVARR